MSLGIDKLELRKESAVLYGLKMRRNPTGSLELKAAGTQPVRRSGWVPDITGLPVHEVAPSSF